MEDYLKWIRSRVGKKRIFINFAGGLVQNIKGEILLQKRSSTDEHWGFPGGVMNLGESAEEAAIREIKEEAITTRYSVCPLLINRNRCYFLFTSLYKRSMDNTSYFFKSFL